MNLTSVACRILPLLAFLFCLGGSAAYGQKETSAGKIADWRKAAGHGNAEAQLNLGLCYSRGEGVVKDYTEAVKWFLKAAEQGDMHSQGCLGAHYGNGQGVMQDEIEGYKWTFLTAAQGEAAAKKINRLPNAACRPSSSPRANDVPPSGRPSLKRRIQLNNLG